MKTALEILNQVEPNGELLDTDQALEAMELYAVEYAKSLKEDKWIRVSEKMPDFDVSVLVFCRIYGVFIAQHKYIGDFQGEKYGNWYDGKDLGVLPPLFWMPLPSPPKTEK
ncbi:MAG: DUF551 domain-containing protein [Bacteroidetes bacterium]|nr:DUF551 domain-containing protein [Bacteroidota bacterium]